MSKLHILLLITALSIVPAQAGATATLWDRLTAQFELGAVTEREEVQRWARDFASRPHEIRTLANRSKPYLYHIVSQIEDAGIPGEIALIPFLESGFDPFAYSSGDAAGIWQFVSTTAKRFGLSQTWWYDGRRDVLASTDAAIEYLNYLQERYNDWPISMAAYNAGEGRVWGAIRKNGRSGKPVDFWSLSLPGQTEAYVPRILGLAAVISDPARYGITLPLIEPFPETVVIDLERQIELDVLARMANVQVDWIYRLNPGFNRFATDPAGPHRVLIPIDRSNQVLNALARLRDDKRIAWQRYRIRPGDTLSQLADRYNMPAEVIQQINKLDRTTLTAGQTLRMPRPHASLALVQETKRRNAVVRRHTVRNGESLWRIARRHNTTVKAIKRANRIPKSGVIQPGQVLRIPGSKIGASTYVIQAGDSLSEISERFGVSKARIMRRNGIKSEHLIRAGQRLSL